MPDHDPEPRRRLTIREARTVRHWILGLAGTSFVLIALSPFTTEGQDRILTLIAAATLATGAIVVRRPVGFRAILALCAAAAMFSTFG